MRIYVHPDLHLSGEVLTDIKLGVRYSLTPDTAWLLRQLLHESRAERIVLSATRQKGVARHEARQALYSLLGYLNTIGGVRIVHSPQFYVGGWMNQLSWRRRYAPGGLGFWRAMGRSYGLLFAALTGLFIGVYAAVPHMSLLIVTLPAAVLMSCVVHEAGHLVAVRHSDTPSFLLSSFGYAAVTYVQPSRRWSRLIAAAGPCMAAAVYITAALYISPILLKCIAVSTALLHLGALLPWFADGKTLWRTL